MTDRRSSDVLGALPHSRPHRRSDKRGTRPTSDDASTQDAARQSSGGKRAPARTADASAKPARAADASAKPARRAKPASGPKSAPRSKPAARAKPAVGAEPATGSRAASSSKAAAGPKAAPSSSRARSGPKASTPKRTSGKAGSRPRISQPAQPGGTPKTPRADQPEAKDQPDVLGTAVQAAAELAEIGLTVGARVLRSAMSRLPRP